MEQRKANELPLNGRNIYNLTTVAPSVVPQGNTQGSPVGKNPFDFANYQIGGSFANESAEYLDGQPLNIGYINLPIADSDADSIGEFKVQYNNLGPEWGKFSGGVINLSTKSGTNQFHGEAYEYLRNKVLNSTGLFRHREDRRTLRTSMDFQWVGRSLKTRHSSSPVGNSSGLRQGQTLTTTVPVAAFRQGDFSALTAQGIQLFDPYTVQPDGSRTPYANNQIPVARI